MNYLIQFQEIKPSGDYSKGVFNKVKRLPERELKLFNSEIREFIKDLAKHKRAKESTRGKKKIFMHIFDNAKVHEGDNYGIIVQRPDKNMRGVSIANCISKNSGNLTVEALKNAIKYTEMGRTVPKK